MKSHYLSKKIGRILAALFFLVSIGLVSSTAVQAQWPYPQDRDRDRDYRRDRDRDRDQDRDRDYRRDRDRDRDYDRNRNQNDDWRYRRNGGYGNNGGYQIAFNQGYQDGLYTGQNDSARGQNYDPQRSHFYRNGHSDNGYNNGRYGDRYQDQQAYREGFLQGYNQGYQRYRGSRNRRNGNNGRWPFPW